MMCFDSYLIDSILGCSGIATRMFDYQVMPNGERHSTRTITKTPKQTQLDEEDNQSDEAEEYTTKKQQQRQTTAHEKASRAEEQKRIKTLKAQAQAESESAVGAVQMMSDVGDLPGLDNDDPNYDLIRKIAHLTGRNYAGQGLTTEELQETLDDPMACTTPGVGDLHQANDQPPFAAFYPGITFGSAPESAPKPKSTSGTSKRNRQHSTDSPSAKRQRVPSDQVPPRTPTAFVSQQAGSRNGSTVPPEAASRHAPLTRTDNYLRQHPDSSPATSTTSKLKATRTTIIHDNFEARKPAHASLRCIFPSTSPAHRLARMPSRLIAYTASILHYVINGYHKGAWNNDRMNSTTQGVFFRQFLKEYEHEENANGYQRAYGERYREKIYDIGRAAYEEHMPVQEDPLPPAKGTWGEDMQMDMDLV
ncbi:unnamed protein product [Rhizoctonia solani]|uniref:Uncharacterized protein n=1 Tax=Rhizoctonia solani TaxID=456999 RepID=A0A8H3GYP3_9AGAM|nr:unnamed protein product [Rhizoctonia solani]CAE6531507.1 unnamed protein product [Rhizoctonia solani]